MANESETTLPVLSVEQFFPPRTTTRLLFDGRTGIVNGPEHTISEQPLPIGRAVDNTGLKIRDLRVSRHHARISRASVGTHIVLENRSSNGSFVNGRRVNTAVLGDGDIIRVGNSFLVVRFVPEHIEDASIPPLVGSSPEMCLLRRDISMVANTSATVLICGETGTGKELVARAVHELSARSGPFIAVNCAAIPSTLAESQLFGHLAGAFTGAQGNHKGFFHQADKGTLFLDEVGELPLEIQPKLLRLLEDHVVTPVGGVTPIPFDVRIVAATNRDLVGAIEEQSFRADLYSRLAEFTLSTPPLSKRREDILPLFKQGFDNAVPKLSPDLVEILLLHPWRYNVRELFKIVTFLKIQATKTDRLEVSHVQHRLQSEETHPTEGADATIPAMAPPPERTKFEIEFPTRVPESIPLQDSDKDKDKDKDKDSDKGQIPSRERLVQALHKTQGNVSKLSRAIGKSRRQTYRYLKLYDIRPDTFRS